MLGGSIAVIAAEAPSTQPIKHATTHPAVIKVESPYNKLTGLTDVQNSKLAEIHKQYLADRKALDEKATADSREVLTDDQKAELDKMLAEKKEEASDKNKARRGAKAATTAPAAD